MFSFNEKHDYGNDRCDTQNADLGRFIRHLRDNESPCHPSSDKGAIAALTERSTNMILMEKLPEDKLPEPLAKVVIRQLFPYRNTIPSNKSLILHFTVESRQSIYLDIYYTKVL